MHIWTDNSNGKYGYKSWMYLISWIVLFNVLNFLFGNALKMIFIESNDSFPIGIYFALVVIYCMLFLGGLLFLLESKKTARIISLNDMDYCVQLYLWGKLQFKKDEIKNIDIYNPSGIKRQTTPFRK